MKKRSLAMLLSGLMVFTLIACGSSSETAVQSSKSAQSASSGQNKATPGKVKIIIEPPSGWMAIQPITLILCLRIMCKF